MSDGAGRGYCVAFSSLWRPAWLHGAPKEDFASHQTGGWTKSCSTSGCIGDAVFNFYYRVRVWAAFGYDIARHAALMTVLLVPPRIDRGQPLVYRSQACSGRRRGAFSLPALR
jgi:hypothetical protein